jgi:hypothetical protein
MWQAPLPTWFTTASASLNTITASSGATILCTIISMLSVNVSIIANHLHTYM